jgi:hypothetical protein
MAVVGYSAELVVRVLEGKGLDSGLVEAVSTRLLDLPDADHIDKRSLAVVFQAAGMSARDTILLWKSLDEAAWGSVHL